MVMRLFPGIAAALLLAAAAATPASAEIAVGLQQNGRALTIFDPLSPQASATVLPIDQSLQATQLETIAYGSDGKLYATSAERNFYSVDISGSSAVVTPVPASGSKPFFADGTPPNSPASGVGGDWDAKNNAYFFTLDALNPMDANGPNPFLEIPAAGWTTTPPIAPIGQLKYSLSDATNKSVEPAVGGVGFLNGTLYGIDTQNGVPFLVKIDPAGVLSRVPAADSAGLGGNTQTLPGIADPAFGPSSDAGYVVLGQGAATLYALDPATGLASNPQPIPGPLLTELTFQPNGLIGVGSVAASEKAKTGSIVVTRSRGTTGKVTVDYKTSDGTAKAGSDYTSTAGTLTFNNGESQKIISVPIADDGKEEPDETFDVTLLNPTGGLTVPSGQLVTTVTITDSGTRTNPTPPPPPPTPLPPPPPVGGKPTLIVKSQRIVFHALVDHGIAFGFGCSVTCTARGSLKLGTKTVGKGLRVKHGKGLGTVSVRLTKLGIKALRKALATKTPRKLKVSVTVIGNGTTTHSAKLTVRR